MGEEKKNKYLAFYFNPIFKDPFKIVEKNGVKTKTVKDTRNIVFPGDIIVKIVEEDFVDPNIYEKQDYIAMGKGDNVDFDETQSAFVSLIYGYALLKGRKIEVKPVIEISKSKLIAYMYYLPSSKGKYPTIDDIRQTISTMHYKGYVEDNHVTSQVDKFVSQKKKYGVLTVCKGQAPKDGQIEHFVLLKTIDRKIGKELEDGRMNFKEKDFFTPIEKGDQILEKKPHIPAMDGFDVMGNSLKGKLIGEKNYVPGKNLELSKDNPDIYLASTSGVLSISQKKVSVENKTIIKKDIDYETGNIKVEGTLEIFGNVKSGFEIRATGDVFIHGNVEDAIVIGGNNVRIDNGVLGKDHAMVHAENNIITRFGQNATFKAGNDMLVKESLVQCQIFAKNIVIVEGTVVGGEISGKNGLTVKIAGSETGVETKLTVGKDIEMEERIKMKEEKKKDMDHEHNDLLDDMKMQFGNQFLVDLKGFLGYLKGTRKAKFVEMLSRLSNFKKQIKGVKEEIENLKKQITFIKPPVINIKEKIFSDVVLQIRKSVSKIKQERLGTVFKEDRETGVIIE